MLKSNLDSDPFTGGNSVVEHYFNETVDATRTDEELYQEGRADGDEAARGGMNDLSFSHKLTLLELNNDLDKDDHYARGYRDAFRAYSKKMGKV